MVAVLGIEVAPLLVVGFKNDRLVPEQSLWLCRQGRRNTEWVPTRRQMMCASPS